jgi:transposase
MWLTGRLAPDFKTIARFRKDNCKAIRSVCRQLVMLCQRLDLFAEALVAIDGSKFKAVNHHDHRHARLDEIETALLKSAMWKVVGNL